MKDFSLKKVIQWLGMVLRCPVCGHKYDVKNTRVLDSERDEFYNEAWALIHSDCGKCKSSVMFNLEIHGPEVFSVGMVTDLTASDGQKFNRLSPIQANDVLAIHQELKTFEGDFVSSFDK